MPPGTTTPVTEDISLNAAAFRRSLEYEGKSDKTIDSYSEATTQLITYLTANGMPLTVASLTREHVESFLLDLRQRGRSDSTRANRYRSLQQFFKYLQAEGELRESPMRNMRPPRIVDNPPHTVSPAEMTRLLAACEGTGFADRRDTAILYLFYDSGVRRAEMAGVGVGDLDLATKTMKVTGKGDRIRLVRYGRDAARAIDRYLRARARHPDAATPALWLGQSGGLSPYGIEQLVKRRAVRAGLAHIHCHSLRHGFANNFLALGGNESDLMQLAGWRSRQMADRYARSVSNERARSTFDPHSPGDALRRR